MFRSYIFGLARRLTRDRRGSVLMIVGFAIVPITFSTGMAIDYAKAARLQTKVNAITDAAALAAVTEPMMRKTRNDAALAALNMFSAQATGLNGLVYTLSGPRVTSSSTSTVYDYGALKVEITQSDETGLDRTATVQYSAASMNDFAGILGLRTWAIRGSSVTNAKMAPNIDFYVMLDVSSSMSLPVTSAGITQMKDMTGGCAFACHQTNPNTSDGIKQYNSSGQMIDYYAAAKNAGIVLRVDNGKTAIQDMIDRATSSMLRNSAVYRMSVSTFDRGSNFNNIAPLTATLSTAKTQTGNAQMVSVTKGSSDWDRQSEHSDSIVKAGALIPAAAGTGTTKAGDTPQAILFIVTDGMRDEERGGRQMGAIPIDQCTTIKNRLNTRIAVLYTTYQPESIAGDGWSQDNVAWRLPSLLPALQSCASPGLFFEVSTDGSISAAITALFDKAIATAHIVQ